MAAYEAYKVEMARRASFHSKRFITLFTPANLFYMKICKEFVRTYLYVNSAPPINRYATLRMGQKDSWPTSFEVKVEFDEQSGAAYLTDGWQKFVRERLLRNFDNLTFEYNSNMDFEVIGHNEYNNNVLAIRSSPAFFHSPFPYFHIIMKENNLGENGYVHMPKAFAEEYYGHVYNKNHEVMVFIKCQDAEAEKGSAWNGQVAKLEPCNDGRVKLPLGNLSVVIHLDEDDVCVVELAYRHSTSAGHLCVKIFRASNYRQFNYY